MNILLVIVLNQERYSIVVKNMGSEFPEMELQMSLRIGKERCLISLTSEMEISNHTDYKTHDLDCSKLTRSSKTYKVWESASQRNQRRHEN